jgi:hypothetical protein
MLPHTHYSECPLEYQPLITTVVHHANQIAVGHLTNILRGDEESPVFFSNLSKICPELITQNWVDSCSWFIQKN